jgi:tyrosine phenol-lyase
MKQAIKNSWLEPYKMKMVELLKMTSRPQRIKAIKEAGYNTFLLKSEDVYIDLLTDSGTSAMSDRQWAGLMMGDEAYDGSRNFFRLGKTIQKYYGYKYIISYASGKGAENTLSKVLIKKGDIIPGNMYFTTTRLHQELAGGTFADVIIDEAHDSENEHPFKANVDLKKLDALVKKYEAKRIPYVCIAINVNMAGRQPISMKSLKEVRSYTKNIE